VKGEMMEIHPAVQGGAEQGSARVGRGQGTSLPNHVFQEVLNAAGSRTRMFYPASVTTFTVYDSLGGAHSVPLTIPQDGRE